MKTTTFIKELSDTELKTLMKEVEECKLHGKFTETVINIMDLWYNNSNDTTFAKLSLDVYKEAAERWYNN